MQEIKGSRLALVRNFNADTWLRQWIEARKHNAEKMHLVPTIRRCLEISGEWYKESGEITTFETFENMTPDYRFMGGFGAFEHLRFYKALTTSGLYKASDDWKNATSDEQIYQDYLGRSNDRYLQTDDVWVKERPYVLVPLQFVYPKDYHQSVALVEWATTTKTYTVFKRHPASSSQSQTPRDYDKFWSVMERSGMTSEYTHFPVENYNSTSMVSQCDMLISVDSAMTLQAMLHNKPAVNLRRCMISDIVPLMDYKKLDESVLDVSAVSVSDQIRWLTWYWNTCVNDFHAENFEWKLNRRRDLYLQGYTDDDLYSWEFTKNAGFH